MSRTPSITAGEAEALLGPRGDLSVTSDNRDTVRKWVVANGIDSSKAYGASVAELEAAYNDVRGDGLKAIANKGGLNGGNARQGQGNGQGQGQGEDQGNFGNDAGGDAGAQIADIVNKAIAEAKRKAEANAEAKAPKIDRDEIAKIIKEEIGKVVPRPVHIKKDGIKIAEIKERTHPCFERVLKLVAAGENVMLVGPAGCGKTHMAEQIARALNAKYGAIHGSAGASESALTGWLLPSDGGKFEYVPAPFVSLYEQGESVFLLDEYDAFDPNMVLVANGALANGHMHIAHRKDNPVVKRGQNTRIMATANTYGTGANPLYSARNIMDGASNDRFLIVTMDYDEAFEKELGAAGGLTDTEMESLWSLRRKVRESGLRRIISTRAFKKAITMKACGDSWKTVISTLTEGWTRDEKAKVGL